VECLADRNARGRDHSSEHDDAPAEGAKKFMRWEKKHDEQYIKGDEAADSLVSTGPPERRASWELDVDLPTGERLYGKVCATTPRRAYGVVLVFEHCASG